MTKLEKMTVDYVQEHKKEFNMANCYFEQCYEAGFKAAREMLVNMPSSGSWLEISKLELSKIGDEEV